MTTMNGSHGTNRNPDVGADKYPMDNDDAMALDKKRLKRAQDNQLKVDTAQKKQKMFIQGPKAIPTGS